MAADRQNYFAEDNTRSTTTSSTYQDKLSLTFTPDANSDYLLIFCAIIDGSSTSLQRKVRLYDSGNSTVLTETDGVSRNTNDKKQVFGIKKLSFGASPSSQTYKVQYASNGTATVGIDNVRIIAIKLDSADEYAESEANSTNDSTIFATKTTLTFTPATQGDYLIIAYAEGQGDDVFYNPDPVFRLDIDGSTYDQYQLMYWSNVNEWNPWISLKRVNLTAASHSIKIQFATSNWSRAVVVTIRKARIAAIRLDNFYNNYYAENDAAATTSATTYQDRTTLTQTVQAGEHLILSHSQLNSPNGQEETYHQFSDDGTGTDESVELPGSSGDAMPTLTILRKSLSNQSYTWKNQYKTNDGTYAIEIEDSRISVIQLKSNVVTKTHTTDSYLVSSKRYSRESTTSLPTDNTDLSTIYSSSEYTDVGTSDDTRVILGGAGNYNVHLFKAYNSNRDNTEDINVSVECQSNVAPSTATVYLQIYNYSTSSWETLASNNTAGANVDFTLTGSKTASQSNYYDSDYMVSLRIYQAI